MLHMVLGYVKLAIAGLLRYGGEAQDAVRVRQRPPEHTAQLQRFAQARHDKKSPANS